MVCFPLNCIRRISRLEDRRDKAPIDGASVLSTPALPPARPLPFPPAQLGQPGSLPIFYRKGSPVQRDAPDPSRARLARYERHRRTCWLRRRLRCKCQLLEGTSRRPGSRKHSAALEARRARVMSFNRSLSSHLVATRRTGGGCARPLTNFMRCQGNRCDRAPSSTRFMVRRPLVRPRRWKGDRR